MTIWRVVVDVMLPPPLILSTLLLLPMPRAVNKGLLSFARNVLFFEVAGALKLVHFMILVSGLMLLAAGVHTQQLRLSVPLNKMDSMDAKQQITARAHIWREERNFWISALTFLLWGFLYRVNALLLEHQDTKDKLFALQGKGGSAPPASTKGGVPAGKLEEPTAPEVPEPRGSDLRQRKVKVETD